MSWNSLNKPQDKVVSRELEARLELQRQFTRCFSSEDGEKVLQHLSNKFIYNNNTPLESANITYVAGYKNGESGAIKYIIEMMVEHRDEYFKEKENP
jgi:hypothetical protein